MQEQQQVEAMAGHLLLELVIRSLAVETEERQAPLARKAGAEAGEDLLPAQAQMEIMELMAVEAVADLEALPLLGELLGVVAV